MVEVGRGSDDDGLDIVVQDELTVVGHPVRGAELDAGGERPLRVAGANRNQLDLGDAGDGG